jgi:hypothetical protein
MTMRLKLADSNIHFSSSAEWQLVLSFEVSYYIQRTKKKCLKISGSVIKFHKVENIKNVGQTVGGVRAVVG